MKTTKPTNRRNFLISAGLGSAGVAAAVATGGVKPATGRKEAAAAQPSGYHDSEHIQKYYKTTKV
jgi:hypothetical protein